jgi:hypothetical protein
VTAGTTQLANLTVSGGPMADVWVSGTGAFHGEGIVLTNTLGCVLWVASGTADLTDSVVKDGGSGGCGATPGVLMNGEIAVAAGAISLTRVQVMNPQERSAAVVLVGGELSADESLFDDSAHDRETSDSDGVDLKGGSATVTHSTVHAFGTGVMVEGGTASVSDDTFQGNVVGLTSSSGSATVVRSTFEGELASVQQQETGSLGVAGSVMGVDGIMNCAGDVTDLGYNLADTAATTDPGCGFTASTSRQHVTDLNLDTDLADHGGEVSTVGIRNPSAAVDAIPAGATYGNASTPLCPTTGSTDIRGVPRPVGGACDAGSFEMTGTHTSVRARATARPGAEVTLGETVAVPAVGVPGLEDPTGDVVFGSHRRVLCRAHLDAGGSASCTTSDIPVGRTRIEATFSPATGSTLHPSSVATTITVGTHPSIQAPRRVILHVGRRAKIRITASGQPRPWVSLIRGHLPRGMKFHHRRGHASITGIPARRTAGTHHRLRIEAGNLLGHAHHRITLVVRCR